MGIIWFKNAAWERVNYLGGGSVDLRVTGIKQLGWMSSIWMHG